MKLGTLDVADVFLSYARGYAREDKATARRLAEAMEARGFDVWWDAEILPGETWDQMIERELAAARCAVVLWSKTSVGKTWVRTEATEAQKSSVLIPVLLEDVQQPIAFRLTQTVSLVGWNGGEDHKGYRQLLGAIARLVRDPTIPPEIALREAQADAPPPSPTPRVKPRRWPLLASAGGVALAAAVGFLIFSQDKQAPPSQRVVSTVQTVRPPAEPDVKDFSTAAGIDRRTVPAITGRYPFASQRYLSASDLRTLSNAELKIMRNEIFARHGYIFKTDAMKRYFSRQSWYRPDSHNVIDRLSPVELANVETIKAVEKGR